jgi:hypothetical protein
LVLVLFVHINCTSSLRGLSFLLSYGIGSSGIAVPFEYFHVETRTTAATKNWRKRIERGRSSVVGIVTLSSRVHIPVGARDFSAEPVWGPPSALFSGYRGPFLEIKRLGLEVHHSAPPNATVNNESSTPPVCGRRRIYLL